VTLTFLLSSIKRHLRLVILVALLGLGAGIALPFVRGSVYTAEASVLLAPPGTSTGFQDADKFIAAQLNLLSSTALLEKVAAKFPGETPRTLRQAVTVALEPPSAVTISAISVDASQAAELANTYALSYLDDQRERLTGSLDADIAVINDQIASLDEQTNEITSQLVLRPTDAALITQLNSIEDRRSRLLERQNDLQAQVDEGISSELTAPAEVPEKKTGLTPLQWALLGLFAGTFAGVGLAAARAAMSGMLLDAQQLEELLGSPVAARIPVVSELAGGPEAGLEILPVKVAARLDRLCVRAEGVGPADGRQLRVAVVGTAAECGVTTLSLMLGARMAQSRMTVGLVDADGLSPWISRRLSRSGGNGSGEAAGWSGTTGPGASRGARGRGRAAGTEVATVTQPGRELHPTAVPTAHERLVVIGEGTRAEQLFQEAGLDDVLDALGRTDVDIVVFDGGSLIDAALAVRLAQQVDVVVLVVPLARQPIDQIRVVRRLFEGRDVEVLPVVTDVVPRRRLD